MSVQASIDHFFASQTEAKRSELMVLDALIRRQSPSAELWFLDGRDESGKVVTNPSIGYGSYTNRYADGSSRICHRIGLSANKTGISVYILGLSDKNYLSNTIGSTIGKAAVTGYCIRFRSIKDINLDVLGAAIRYGLDQTS